MEYILNFFKSFSSFISQLNDNGVLDFVGLILSTIVPIVIMSITLKHEKNLAKQDALEKEQQYQESMRIAKQQHIEQLAAQNEINRVSIMPYLTIENVTADCQMGRTTFTILFKNIGNGTAINLSTIYLESSTRLCPVCETILATYCCIEPFDVYLATVRPDDTCILAISQELNDTSNTSIINADCFSLTATYTDMRQQKYEQTFAIYFDAKNLTNIKIYRKIINNPELK